MFKLIFIITNLAYIFFLFTTVYSCPQKKTGGAAAPSAPPVPAPLDGWMDVNFANSSTVLNTLQHPQHPLFPRPWMDGWMLTLLIALLF